MTREEEILIEKVIWLIEDCYPDTDEWGHDTLVKRIKEDLAKRADELNRMFTAAHPINPWHKASEELPGKGQLVLISNPAIQFAIYDGLFRPVLRIGRKFEVADEHVFVETKYWMEIPEIKED